MDFEKEALRYHESDPKGKIAIKVTKPLESQEDLSIAYSPGVAGPCRKIAENVNESFTYTGRGNLVGVISNGSAVLGLGNIGAYASKPVMEGKAMLFKKFADIDVFDIEVDDKGDIENFINAVKTLEPTFGGINLEDIKAPECFYVEEKLQSLMQIPVFHDDQHGTAIIAAAAFINALDITGRKIEDVKIAFSGAGAAAIGCARLFLELGVKPENLLMCDSKGVIHTERTDLNEYKKKFAIKTKKRTLEDAMDGADAFLGVSVAGVLTEKMLKSMAKNPIVFAMANPDPEIMPNKALQIRSDVIIATGRSDFPNQVNNVLGFPYIFRGALDVRAKGINKEMVLAAVHAIAGLAKTDVPEEVMTVYKEQESYVFGRDYLIPKPVDPRVLLYVAPAVAKAAMDTGMARIQLDIEAYREELENILGPNRRIITKLRQEIKHHKGDLPKIVIPCGTDNRALKAAKQATDEGELKVVLLGHENEIRQRALAIGIENFGPRISILDPNLEDALVEELAEVLYKKRNRRGVSKTMAQQIAREPNYFATLLVESGKADGMVGGITESYAHAVKPVLEIIKPAEDRSLAGVYMMVIEKRLIFFADCTLHIDPTAEQLANIATETARFARAYNKEPVRVAMLSFASFGASDHKEAKKVSKAVELLRRREVDFEVDGEMQADVALNASLREKEFPFSTLTGDANVLVFSNLAAANSAYKILTQLGGAVPTGPILAGLNKPAHILQRSATTREVVDMIYMSAHNAVHSH